MLYEYKKEDKSGFKETTYEDLLKNIKESENKLKDCHHNLNYVKDEGLVDYYIYRIRSEQSRLNYLIKQVKSFKESEKA